ncbi:hypothetical protein ACT4UL_15160, partial [Bacillus sp. HC-TM]
IDGHTTGAYPVAVPPGTAGFLKAEAVMLIEAGLSTYEKECAKRGDDYQEIFAQQVRETMERRAAGLKPPAWAAAAFESGLRQSTEEEKSDSRAA